MIEDLMQQLLGYYEVLIILLPKLALGIVLISLFLFLFRFFRRRFIKWIRSRAADPLLVNFINDIIRVSNITIALLLFLYIVGLAGLAGTVLGAAGLSAFIIGFAFRDIGENFLAGIILAFNRPFRVGDVLNSSGIEGRIVDINLRETHIKTFDGKDVYVPNGQILKNPLYNYTIDGFLQKSFNIGVDYGYDLENLIKEIYSVLSNVKGVLTEDKMPSIIIKELGDSYIVIEIKYWINTFDTTISGIDINNTAIQKVLNHMNAIGIHLPGNIIELRNALNSNVHLQVKSS